MAKNCAFLDVQNLECLTQIGMQINHEKMCEKSHNTRKIHDINPNRKQKAPIMRATDT